VRAAVDRDADGLLAGLDEMGFLNHPEHMDADRVLEQVLRQEAYIFEDRPFTVTAEYVSELVRESSDPRSELFRMWHREAFPPDELMFRRMETGVLAVLALLQATANWHRIAREWWFGEEPQTELGRAEWAFLDGRRLHRDRRTLAAGG